MEYRFGTLGLKIPVLTKKHNLWSEQCSNEIKENISNIAKDDTGKMAKSIYLLLVDCNQTELSTEQRLSIIEALNPYICSINQMLTEEHLDKAESKIENRRTICQILQSLYNEMSYSAKLIIEELAPQPKKHKKELQYALYYGISYLMEILHICSLSYIPAPKLLWKELHIYYQITLQCRLLSKKIKNNDGRLNIHSTIEDTYKHCLLFSIASPFRFRQNEIKNLHLAIACWAPLLQLSHKNSKKTLFFIDLALDMAPKYLIFKEKNSETCLYLTLEKINHRILEVINKLKVKDKISLIAEETPEFLLSIDTLSFIKKTWTLFSKRGQERISKEGSIRVTLGLANTFNAIEKNSTNSTNDLESTAIELEQNEEIIDMDILPGKGLKSPINKTSEYFNCEFVDISEGGFCLRWADKVPPNLKTGEIIGLEQNPQQPSILSIGTIRWIKDLYNQNLLIGIQLLGEYGTATKTKLPEQSSTHSMQAIILPEMPMLGNPISILTPALPFKENMEINVVQNNQEYDTKLNRLLEQTNSFKQFCFDPQSNLEFYINENIVPKGNWAQI